MQQWQYIQGELLPELKACVGVLTPKLEKLVHMLEWIRIEEFVRPAWCGIGRVPHDRHALANAFVAKVVLGVKTTRGLIERLMIDRALRRICGFSMWKKLPDEATFSRAFAEFAKARLAERAHEALIKTYLGESIIGHISRDGTAIEVREKPRKMPKTELPVKHARKRGRPSKGEERPASEPTQIQKQLGQILSQMLAELPRECDHGTMCNIPPF